MKIYSWNILFENKKLDAALTFIKSLDFDVLCLQEVPEGFLPVLKSLPFNMTSAVDAELFLKDGSSVRMYVVILSPHSFIKEESFALPLWDWDVEFSRLAWALIRTLQFVGTWPQANAMANRHGIFVDIKLPHAGKVRILDAHLTLANPLWRTQDLGVVFEHLEKDTPTIICGDFNVADTHKVSIISGFLGGTIKDSLLPHLERKNIENIFLEQGFMNPLRGKVTHPLTNCQLDHILVPLNAEVLTASVLRDSKGSDHRPIFVETA